MKFYNLILIIFFCIPGVLSAQKDYDYRRKISGNDQEMWYALTIPPEAFQKLNRDFSDLRFFGFSGKDTTEFPYLLKIRTDDVKEEVVQLPVINKSKKDGTLYLTFELKNQKVNYLDLKFSQANFFALAKLEGSHDQKEWFEITDNQRLLSIKNETADYTVSTINFPVSDYKFLRIGITSDIPLTLASASFRNQVVKKGLYNTINSQWSVSQDKKAKQNIVDIKLEHYVPVSNFNVRIDSKNDYYRQFSVSYVSDSAETPKGWTKFYQQFFDGYLTSYTPNTFNVTYDLVKEIRIIINNLDNAPLTISDIEVAGPAIELISQLKPGDVFLYYGNPKAAKPSYDLDYFQEKIPSAYNYVTAGTEEDLMAPIAKGSPLFENKFWLWVIIIVVIAVLGFFTLRMMKAKPKGQV